MNTKQQILAELSRVFDQWQKLLAGLSDEQVTAPLSPSDWSVKDVLVHLWGWQQASVARAEAALRGGEPKYPKWWEMFGPDPEEDVDRTNAWIHETYKDKPWSSVYADWKAQVSRYLELAAKIPEKDLLESGRFAWMGSYALFASLEGSWDHHKEHIEELLAWLDQHGNTKTIK